MKIEFSGILTTGDSYRVDTDEDEGSILIDGVDVLDAVTGTKFDGPVTVAFGDERFTGDLDTDLGLGYSEYTPMDPDKWTVGTHDLIKILSAHEGKPVRLVIADEPVNMLELAA